MFSQLSNRTKGLISGSAELREQAAEGLGELVDVTGEQTLKEFVVPITGPLIRIIGDRFPWQVKSAILSTLCIIISKGGVALKPFLPQLQTTFIKCLQDNARTVCSSAALALGKLSALSTRVDPLVSDLLSLLQASDGGTRQAVLVALKCVVKHAGKIVSSPVRSRALTLLKDLIQLEDDHIRSSAGGVLGTLSQFPIRETANRALGRLLVYHVQGEAPSAHGPSELIPCLASTLRDDSSEVRRRALSGLKAITKENPSALFPFLTILGPALAECMKDGNTPVRLAAERCALHVFQLTKGSEHVQASQKYITGLDARRISKLPVNSDDSEDGEEDMLR